MSRVDVGWMKYFKKIRNGGVAIPEKWLRKRKAAAGTAAAEKDGEGAQRRRRTKARQAGGRDRWTAAAAAETATAAGRGEGAGRKRWGQGAGAKGRGESEHVTGRGTCRILQQDDVIQFSASEYILLSISIDTFTNLRYKNVKK